MQAESPNPVKFFIGVLYSQSERLEQALALIEKEFSPIDYQSKDYHFDVTDYYQPEMGAPIFRRIISLTELNDPIALAQAKLTTNAIEMQLAVEARRKVNLDIGYIDYDKVVLASAKYGIHKVYIGHGIYADMALHYEKGGFSPYAWAFLDFKESRYYRDFMQIRIRYKQQMKK